MIKETETPESRQSISQFTDAKDRIWEIFTDADGKCSIYLNFYYSKNIRSIPQGIFTELKDRFHCPAVLMGAERPDSNEVMRIIEKWVPVTWKDSKGNQWEFKRVGFNAEKWKAFLIQFQEGVTGNMIEQLERSEFETWRDAKAFVKRLLGLRK
jgi:hypothetical protein